MSTTQKPIGDAAIERAALAENQALESADSLCEAAQDVLATFDHACKERYDEVAWAELDGGAFETLRAALAAQPQATDADLERRTGEPHVAGWPLVSGLPAPAEGDGLDAGGEMLLFRVADDLKRALKAAGLRQCDVACRLGVSEAEISNRLSGERNLTLSTLREMAELANLRVIVSFKERGNV